MTFTLPDLPPPIARSLPFNEEAEAALVARLLVDPEQVPIVAGSLPPEDFYISNYRAAFEAMQKLTAAHKRIDVLTLQDAIGDKSGELSERLSRIAGYRAPLEEYVAIVRRDAFRRRLITGMEHVAAKAYIEEDRDALVAALHDTVVQVSTGTDDDSLISPAQAAEAYLASLALRKGGAPSGLTYGFNSIDAILNPAAGGEMIVLAARPSVGKTALAETISDHWAGIAPYPVLFVSLEMSLTKLIDRTVARRADLPAKDLVRGNLTDDQFKLAEETATARKASRIWYLDNAHAKTSDVRAAAAKVRIMAGGLSAIVIDYLQLLKDAGDQEVQRVTKISRMVKAIALEFDVPVLVLSQLSRAVMQREDQHPRLHDLRESGAIEQDADVVLGLHRELGEHITDVEVLKQRQGEIGMAHLDFDGDHVRFSEVPPVKLGISILTGLPMTTGKKRYEGDTW